MQIENYCVKENKVDLKKKKVWLGNRQITGPGLLGLGL